MKQPYPTDEMFDDLHEGVEALRSIADNKSHPLSERAVQSLQRLENAMPIARDRFRAWKERLTTQAVKAAEKTNEAAHEHPWIFTLSALGLGLLAGLVLADSEEDK